MCVGRGSPPARAPPRPLPTLLPRMQRLPRHQCACAARSLGGTPPPTAAHAPHRGPSPASVASRFPVSAALAADAPLPPGRAPPLSPPAPFPPPFRCEARLPAPGLTWAPAPLGAGGARDRARGACWAGRAGGRALRAAPADFRWGKRAVTLATEPSWGGLGGRWFCVCGARSGGMEAMWRRAPRLGTQRAREPRERALCLPCQCRGSAPTNAPTQGGVLLELLFAGGNLF